MGQVRLLTAQSAEKAHRTPPPESEPQERKSTPSNSYIRGNKKIARAKYTDGWRARRDTRAGKARPGLLNENPGAFTRVTEAYLFLDVRTVTISELKATANINASKIVRGITPLNCKLQIQRDVQLQFKKRECAGRLSF
ncbi:hypothetical protein UN64_06225 [Fictibacillus arsenicus]|uniref:Uncharacterized protein n=1 Tax=Fictibacillus arsenicus TaxID=255247 RepID=A0A1V3GD50_9BACL|nr:hypothetical protein UN64_06225 [Fictibacillus arsenicus]